MNAKDAGWHVSRYNLSAKVPGTARTAIVNLCQGTCAAYTPLEMYLLSVLDELDEDHPIIKHFAKRGVISRADERAALEAMGRMACAVPHAVSLTIAPTMGCNFDCPYCFEDHGQGAMSAEAEDDVAGLAARMLDASGVKDLRVIWYGGEPLLAADRIESLSKRLMARVSERGGRYQAEIVTNGYLLDQKNADMLGSVQVKSCQITLDGIGAVHDATRHLAGGGATFDRITENLRCHKLPFRVQVRHNVYAGNKNDTDKLEAFVRQIAEESCNKIFYYPALVADNQSATARGRQVGLLCENDAADIGIRQETGRFGRGRAIHCGAGSIWDLVIDELGNLYKCWEAVGKRDLSFGTARDWDPKRPIETAEKPDNLTKYLNSAAPSDDEECRACVWFPLCVGGCPHKRLFDKKRCLSFKHDPEAFVLALYERKSRSAPR